MVCGCSCVLQVQGRTITDAPKDIHVGTRVWHKTRGGGRVDSINMDDERGKPYQVRSNTSSYLLTMFPHFPLMTSIT